MSPYCEMPCPIIGFAAYSGVGKTSLITRVIENLQKDNLRIGVIKHAHHRFEIDKPEKDSYKLRKSGAVQTLVASNKRWALINEFDKDPGDNYLGLLLDQMDLPNLDLVIVEGFKQAPLIKIEIHRTSLKHPLLFPHDPNIVALVTDDIHEPTGSLPVLDINDESSIARFIRDLAMNIPLQMSAQYSPLFLI